MSHFIIGQTGGQEAMVLTDLGATHNFIDEGFVEKKGLKTTGFEGFRVSNANWKLMLVDQIVERFGVRFQRYTVRENFYVYPLDGHPHIIFGVQWLFESGDIHTNYRNLTMSFKIDNKPHTLQGIKEKCPQVTNKTLEVIWTHHEEEKEQSNGTLGLRDIWHETSSEGGAWHPTLGAWHSTLGIREGHGSSLAPHVGKEGSLALNKGGLAPDSLQDSMTTIRETIYMSFI